MTEKPTEKLSMKRLADDIEALRKQVAALEKTIAQPKAAPAEMKRLADDIEALRNQVAALEKTIAQPKAAPAEKPKARATGPTKEITAEQKHALVETLAHFKAARRAQAGQVGDAESDWLEAEGEVTLLLAALRSSG